MSTCAPVCPDRFAMSSKCSRWKKSRLLRREFEYIVNDIAASSSSPCSAPRTITPQVRNERIRTPSRSERHPKNKNEHVVVHGESDDSRTSSSRSTDESFQTLPSSDDSDNSVNYDGAPSPASAAVANEFLNTHEPSEVAVGNIVDDLAAVAQKHNLTYSCINDIASLLRKYGLPVPKDARTVMRTERKAVTERNGTFAHFGLAKGISEALQLEPPPHEIKLQAHIDGVPLFKSSSMCFWPILCRVTNIKNGEPFLVSLYAGKGKPPGPAC